MPFKSEAQRRLFYAKSRRGEISPQTVQQWEEETQKDLPERIKKQAAATQSYWFLHTLVTEMEKEAGMFSFMGDKLLEAGQFVSAGARHGKDIPKSLRRDFGGPRKHAIKGFKEWMSKQRGISYRDPRTNAIHMFPKSQKPGLAELVEKKTPRIRAALQKTKSDAAWKNALSGVAGVTI